MNNTANNSLFYFTDGQSFSWGVVFFYFYFSKEGTIVQPLNF